MNNFFVNMKNLSSKMNELKIKTPGTMNVAEIMNRHHQHNPPPDSGEYAIDVLMIAKYFERIGDHATNIAEWVEFPDVTGSADNAVELYLKGELKGNQNATCAGHGHEK